jgi:hypothetical protein
VGAIIAITIIAGISAAQGLIVVDAGKVALNRLLRLRMNGLEVRDGLFVDFGEKLQFHEINPSLPGFCFRDE